MPRLPEACNGRLQEVRSLPPKVTGALQGAKWIAHRVVASRNKRSGSGKEKTTQRGWSLLLMVYDSVTS